MKKNHEDIKFYKKPHLWVKDKFKTVTTLPGTYIVALLPTIPVLVGIALDFITLGELTPDYMANFVVWLLFIFGLINLLLLTYFKLARIKIWRLTEIFDVINRDIFVNYRNYLSKKKNRKGKITSNEIVSYIKKILDSFNYKFMEQTHRKGVTTTLKYIHQNKFYPIRVGRDVELRKGCEDWKESYVYISLINQHRYLQYIYVKNIDNPDRTETKMLGGFNEQIKSRAEGLYNTFISVPLKRRYESKENPSNLTIKKDLGLLGFDLQEKYGFGNLEQFELNILNCLVEMISELTEDLIYSYKIQN